MVKFSVIVALGCMGAYCQGQASRTLTPRELFFVPAEIVVEKNPSATKPKSLTNRKTPDKARVKAKEIRTGSEIKLVTSEYSGPRPLGLRYSVLKSFKTDFRPVAIDSTFHSGDAIKVRVESNEDGYLYVYSQQSNGKWVLLFPNQEIREGRNDIAAGNRYDLPSPEQQWRMDDSKGEERLYVILSRKPVADLDKVIYSLPGGAAPKRTLLAGNRPSIDDRVIAQLQQKMAARDLVLEKVSEPASQAKAADEDQAAGYVVDKSGLLDASVAADIRLRHE